MLRPRFQSKRELARVKSFALAAHLVAAALAGFFISGCASQKLVNEQLSLCPDYFRQNVGQVRILPFWSAIVPLTGGPVGWLNKSDGTYSLTSLAGKDVVLHESFHSFDFLCWQNRLDEWQAFVKDFTQDKPRKPNVPIYFLNMTVPFATNVPVPGHVRLYGLATGAEDAADCFVFGIRGQKRNDAELMRKCQVIKNYTEGKMANN